MPFAKHWRVPKDKALPAAEEDSPPVSHHQSNAIRHLQGTVSWVQLPTSPAHQSNSITESLIVYMQTQYLHLFATMKQNKSLLSRTRIKPPAQTYAKVLAAHSSISSGSLKPKKICLLTREFPLNSCQRDGKQNLQGMEMSGTCQRLLCLLIFCSETS